MKDGMLLLGQRQSVILWPSCLSLAGRRSRFQASPATLAAHAWASHTLCPQVCCPMRSHDLTIRPLLAPPMQLWRGSAAGDTWRHSRRAAVGAKRTVRGNRLTHSKPQRASYELPARHARLPKHAPLPQSLTFLPFPLRPVEAATAPPLRDPLAMVTSGRGE